MKFFKETFVKIWKIFKYLPRTNIWYLISIVYSRIILSFNQPDIIIVNSDETAKNFWAKQIPILIAKFAAQALESEKIDVDCNRRVESYKKEYQEKVDLLMNK